MVKVKINICWRHIWTVKAKIAYVYAQSDQGLCCFTLYVPKGKDPDDAVQMGSIKCNLNLNLFAH